MADTVTVQGTLSTGVNLQFTVNDPFPATWSPGLNNQLTQIYKPGTGVKKFNKATSRVCVIPASGTDTFNLNTGAITGSETDTLTIPGAGALPFTTTGLNLLEINLAAGGSSTVTVTGGSSNGFFGPILGSGSVTVNGSDSTGYGGSQRFLRSDSVGWTVSASKANLVVFNNDPSNASTFTLTLAGQ